MKRNPLNTDPDGVPLCYAKCDEEDTVCMEDCPADLRDRCMDETCTDNDRDPNNIDDESGKPICFGNSYSSYSTTCQDKCEFSNDCRLESKRIEPVSKLTNSTWLEETIQDIKKDRIHLPMLQGRPAQSVINPPSTRTTAPINYWETSYNRPYNYTSNTQTTSNGHQLQIQLNRPNLTEEQYLYFYGARPAANPLVPGQFEGESWYSRLLKEFVLRSLMYSVQVVGQLVVEMMGRIRWSPNSDYEK